MMPQEPISSAKWQPARKVFTSFDRGYRAEAEHFAPDRLSFWDESAAIGRAAMSRGAGLSYTAASFRQGGSVVEHARFNRLLDFDGANAVLEVETGVTLGQVFAFAAKRGLFLAVQPGHPGITVGGCIGPDVHGKNQFRDGTFMSRIESLRLFHPGHGIIDLSSEREPELFRLTCGGYGLTGNVLSARLRLTPAPAGRVAVRVVPLNDIDSLPAALSDLAEDVDLLYSWHDFNARGSRFGDGFIVAGRFEKDGALDSTDWVPRRGQATDSVLAQHLPASMWNAWTTPLFNRLFRRVSLRPGANRTISLYDFLFPVANKVSYFHVFGRRGFHECQVIVPASRFRDFTEGIRDYLKRNPVPISLASAKLFRGSRELLRFAGDGICLALDFPRSREAAPWLEFLDRLMCQCGGWPNLIKDSRLSRDVVAMTYPGYEQFRRSLSGFDPARRYRSELSDRLGL